MANYGTKYRLATRDYFSNEFTCLIRSKNYPGVVYNEIKGSDPPVFIDMATDSEDVFSVIRKTTARLKLVQENNEVNFDELKSTIDTDQFLIDIEGVNNNTFLGYFDSETYNEDYMPDPIQVELSAYEGFHILKTIRLQDFNEDEISLNFPVTLHDILFYCLYRLPRSNTRVYIACNLYEANHSDTRGPLEHTWVQPNVFLEDGEWVSCYDALTMICELFNIGIFQYNGAFCFIHIPELLNETIPYFLYAERGNQLSSGSLSPRVVLTGNISNWGTRKDWIDANMKRSTMPPFRDLIVEVERPIKPSFWDYSYFNEFSRNSNGYYLPRRWNEYYELLNGYSYNEEWGGIFQNEEWQYEKDTKINYPIEILNKYAVVEQYTDEQLKTPGIVTFYGIQSDPIGFTTVDSSGVNDKNIIRLELNYHFLGHKSSPFADDPSGVLVMRIRIIKRSTAGINTVYYYSNGKLTTAPRNHIKHITANSVTTTDSRIRRLSYYRRDRIIKDAVTIQEIEEDLSFDSEILEFTLNDCAQGSQIQISIREIANYQGASGEFYQDPKLIIKSIPLKYGYINDVGKIIYVPENEIYQETNASSYKGEYKKILKMGDLDTEDPEKIQKVKTKMCDNLLYTTNPGDGILRLAESWDYDDKGLDRNIQKVLLYDIINQYSYPVHLLDGAIMGDGINQINVFMDPKDGNRIFLPIRVSYDLRNALVQGTFMEIRTDSAGAFIADESYEEIWDESDEEILYD